MTFDASLSAADAWFRRRTFRPPLPPPKKVAAVVRDRGWRVTVCLPTLDEEQTVGGICRMIRSALIEEVGLVDQLLVVDSGSRDRTRAIAAAEGASVHLADDILPHVGPLRGKGEGLWKSLAVSQGDVIVWIDADVENFHPRWVSRLVAPLVADDDLVFVKAFYTRPLRYGDGGDTGGRVTEILVRPLFHLLFPELARMIQPLAGECAGRVDALRQVPFLAGYGVDACLLVDLVNRFGLDRLAQVDLGERVHRNRDTLALGRMAHEILHGLLERLHTADRLGLRHRLPVEFAQFAQAIGGPELASVAPTLGRRPAMDEVLCRLQAYRGGDGVEVEARGG